MPLRVDDYILDFKPGSTGIVYFKTSDGVTRKTPELQPVVFNALAAVLLKPTMFDASGFTFRNMPSRDLELIHDRKVEFSEEELQNTEKFKTWQLLPIS